MAENTKDPQIPFRPEIKDSVKKEIKAVLLHFLGMLSSWLSMLRSTRNLAGLVSFITFFRYMLPKCETVEDVIKALAVPLGIIVTSAVTRTIERRRA